VDKLYAHRKERMRLEKELEAWKREEKKIADFLAQELENLGASSMAGAIARFSVKKELLPTVTDWGAVHEFVLRSHDFSLLQNRISSAAWRDYLQEGVLVPGTQEFETVKISLTKRS
jgi:hypothetical protein